MKFLDLISSEKIVVIRLDSLGRVTEGYSKTGKVKFWFDNEYRKWIITIDRKEIVKFEFPESDYENFANRISSLF